MIWQKCKRCGCAAAGMVDGMCWMCNPPKEVLDRIEEAMLEHAPTPSELPDWMKGAAK